MTERFEQTERSRILSIVREELTLPVRGEVTSVIPHTSPDDYTNHAVNVDIPPGDNPSRTMDNVPVATSTSGAVETPKVGDHVLIVFLRGAEEEPIAIQNTYADADKDRAPLGLEGMLRYIRGSLYTEMHPEGDYARISKKSKDDGTPSVRMEVDDSGSAPIVRVSANDDSYGFKMDMSDGTLVLSDEGGTGIELTNDGDVHIYGNVKQHTSTTVDF